MADLLQIKKALEVWPYENLYDIANAIPEKTLNSQNSAAKPADNKRPGSEMPPQCATVEDENLLGCNIVTSPYIPYKQRGIQLKFSMRRLEKAKEGLISKELAKEVWIGRNLFLAPTEKLYQHLSVTSPYKRNVSIEHSFSVLFAQWCIEADPLVQKTVIEAPVDTFGHTIDCVSYLKNGNRLAWEITFNCTNNVTSHAAKLKGKGFSKIIFVCRDHHIRKSTQTILNDAGFEPEFFSTIECMLFSDLIREKKSFETENCK
ncbi:MAG: hypothetical protein WC770_03915 [Phycisphaerae bacterium]